MDPFSSNTLKLKAGIKKIIKLKKKVTLILDDDEKPQGEISGPVSKPKGAKLSKLQPRIETIDAGEVEKDTKFVHGDSKIFSESRDFDVLELESKIPLKRESKKESIISDIKFTYTKENTLFNLNDTIQQDFTLLQSEINKIPQTSKITIYNVCYSICYDSKKPFLLYYLFKYPKSETSSSDLMIFPFKSYKHSSSKSLLTQSNELARSTFSRTIRSNLNDKSNGYIFDQENNNVFVFYNFEFSSTILRPNLLERKQQFWWCLVDELINYKKVLNFPVSKQVYNLLSLNENLIRLYYKNKETITKIEIPAVGFHGTYYEILPLIVSYGLKPSTLYPMMGPFYYFGTFRKAVRYAGWTSTYKPRKIGERFIADRNGLYEKGGIVRFALFLGEMKAFMNLPYDKDDKSERYYNRIKLNPSDKEYEDLTLKLHDHDGKWSEHYSSVYVGRSKLANGGLFMKNPEFITRDFDQQHILSYHELDKTTLVYDTRRQKFKWDPNYEKYHIK